MTRPLIADGWPIARERLPGGRSTPIGAVRRNHGAVNAASTTAPEASRANGHDAAVSATAQEASRVNGHGAAVDRGWVAIACERPPLTADGGHRA